MKTINYKSLFGAGKGGFPLPVNIMGLRMSEINGLKYSDIDYEKPRNRCKKFGRRRTGHMPDFVFHEILEERKRYEKTGADGNMECEFFHIRMTFAVSVMEGSEAVHTYMSLIKR